MCGIHMTEIRTDRPAKFVVGILSRFPELIDEIRLRLTERFGEIHLETKLWPFEATRYYEPSMGQGLHRKFLAFKPVMDPAELPSAKIYSNNLEDHYAHSGRFAIDRPVNIDPGYITLSKLVLASAKDYSHRVYLRDGIFAEVTLTFRDGRFHPWEWTYPDYRSPAYLDFFTRARNALATQLKEVP